MPMPDFVQAWADEEGLECGEEIMNAIEDDHHRGGVWSIVADEFVEVLKYANKHTLTAVHREMGRFVRFPYYSAPWGYEDEGRPDRCESEIVEVFPSQAARTVYRSAAEGGRPARVV